MPSRIKVSRELAEVLKVIAHPDRIRLIEELRLGEHDVNALAGRLGLSSPRVSQHLALLRMQRLVSERREGRHHYYQLALPEMATWIIEGLGFLEGRLQGLDPEDLNSARHLWSAEN